MSVRRAILFGCLLLALLAVAAGITRAPKSASTPVPMPRDMSDLHVMGIDGKVIINEKKNSVCYTIKAFGQERHGEIVGADFGALRKSGQEAVINQIFLNHVREEIKAINTAIALNESLPLVGDSAFAQMQCLDCGGGCGMWTLPGVLDHGYNPPPCACYMGGGECNYVFYHCGPPTQCP